MDGPIDMTTMVWLVIFLIILNSPEFADTFKIIHLNRKTVKKMSTMFENSYFVFFICSGVRVIILYKKT